MAGPRVEGETGSSRKAEGRVMVLRRSGRSARVRLTKKSGALTQKVLVV